MALKRLDEEFDLKPGTQLLPYMKRLLPSLEGRFQTLETERKTVDTAIEEMRAVALQRINEILIPATEDIVDVTTLGFLLGPSSTSVLLELGVKVFIINEGPQRDTFTPSPYVIVERQANIDDYAIARVQYYTRETGALSLNITAFHGNPGPHNDWVISSTPGMADSTKLYHDAVAPMAQQVAEDTAETKIARDEVIAAAQALEAAGLDAQEFVRRDATVPFIAPIRGVHPVVGSNDTTLTTTAWSRARMQEYVGQAMQRTGDTMTGPLTLYGAPTQPLHASTKAYVDSIVLQGGERLGNITIRTTNPTLRLFPSGAQQHRTIEALATTGATRWHLNIANGDLESGGDVGSNFVLHRFNDGGAYLGVALHIARQTAVMTIYNRLDISAGGANINGNISNNGDLHTYRGASGTGVLWLNQARSVHHYWNGSMHHFNAGGGQFDGGLNCHHLTCYSIYTQGHAITTWGLTSHGAMTINGQLYCNNIRMYGGGSNYLEFYDSDWGPMWIHHNQDLIGFLNNGQGWCAYFTNAGHLWCGQYGWIHDYVNNTASNHAWSAANYRWNEANGTFVRETRWAYAGDLSVKWPNGNMGEPYWGAAITGWKGDYYGYTYDYRLRYAQVNINGNWYTTRYD